MDNPDILSADRSMLRSIRVAAIMASAALVTWSGSLLWERWRLHEWFVGTIGDPNSSGRTFNLDMRPIEDISSTIWFIASIVCTALAVSGYAVLCRRVTAPRALLGLGGLLLWGLPALASTVSINFLQERPDQLVTLSNALWMLVAMGGAVALALAARQPRAARQP